VKHAPDGKIILGGNFTIPTVNISNIAYYYQGNFSSIAERGLNGAVESIVYFKGESI
jgi:hypothetical protein